MLIDMVKHLKMLERLVNGPVQNVVMYVIVPSVVERRDYDQPAFLRTSHKGRDSKV